VKKLIVVVVLLAAAGVFVRGTPQCSYFMLRQALASGDVETVERHADLDTAISVAAEIAAASTEESARDAAGDVGAKIASLFTGLFQLANPLGPAVKDELKVRIAKKEYASEWGIFVPGPALKDLLTVQKLDQSALITVSGTCHGKDASLKLVMEKRPGPAFGFINDWKLTGVDKSSLPAFARVCLNGK
jgi:hypothetical protein